MKVESNIYKWKHIPQKPTEDAYESIIDEIRELGKNYLTSDDIAKETIIETIFSKIREINVFPVIYFSEEGIKNEILEMYNKADICFVEGGVYTQLRNGLLMLDYLFPNLHTATTCNESMSMYNRFYNDEILKAAIKHYLGQG